MPVPKLDTTPSKQDLVFYEKVEQLMGTVNLALEEAEQYKESITNKELKAHAERLMSWL